MHGENWLEIYGGVGICGRSIEECWKESVGLKFTRLIRVVFE